MKKREQIISLAGVVMLALVLPGLLRLSNSVIRYVVGAEGRLSAIAVETDRALGPLPQPWRALAQGGENLPTFLDGNIAKISTLKPRYIRIDHIYDQFGVVKRGAGGVLVYDWSRLDKVVGQIQQTGATPFLSLSYMPPALASGDEVSEPKNWNEWSSLVQRTIEHYSGELKIPGMYYEVWNEPDLFGKWKINGKKDYKTLYFYSAKGAAAAQEMAGITPFKLGGPGTTGLYKNWIDGFLNYVLQNRLKLDFVSWHRYDLNLDAYTKDIEQADRWLESHPYFSSTEKIISEMGSNSEAGRENDTRLGAAHLVATMRELMFKIHYGFTFSVTGQWGVLGKPRYDALAMLGRLGTQRLAITGEGTWVRAIGAKDGETYQVLLVNYDPKNAHAEAVPVSFINLKEKNFILRRMTLGSPPLETEVATTEAILQHIVPMTSNSVVLVELEPKVLGETVNQPEE